MAQIDVVTIGNAIVDIICSCDDAMLSRNGLQKGRMRVVENAAVNKSLLGKLPRGVEVAGGAAANTAVGIASFGGCAAFIGKVAADAYGYTFQHDIRSMGVTFDAAMTTANGKETSHSVILVTPDGQRTMNTFLGVSTELNSALIDSAQVASASYTYCESYLLDSPQSKSAFYKAIEIASASDRPIALALSDPDCVSRHRSEIMELLKDKVDILFANERELLSLYDCTGLDAAVRQASCDVQSAILMRSERGSLIVSNGSAIAVPAERVRKVIDMTGSGDLYAAGFLFGMARGFDLARAGTLASFAASEIISQLGARPEARLGQLARLRGLL